MLKQHAAPTTLSEAIRYFADPDVSFAFVVQLRWPGGVACPRCGTDSPSLIRSRRIWKCKGCRRQFSVKVGTIFEDSPLGLDKWLPALWLIANAKNGISSYELHRALGVTQKTAWFMLHRIRLAMQSKSFAKMTGTVEADESFIGGKRGNMHKSKRERVTAATGTKHMQAVLGMLERKAGTKHSTVRLAHVQSTRKAELGQHIHENVEKGSALYTDAHPSYKRLAQINPDDYKHAAIDHAIAYVDGQIHTNCLENFWSLLKRTIKGTYVSVDPFHLFRYLDEQARRFNEREITDGERFVNVLRDIVGKRLTYKELISAEMLPATT
ncbi:MAG: IS1595 family transposase [Gemmatimonadota bacterium]|nr:IS1595 family transposase [Gemmatimonadota bacterium]